jgi:RES domain
VNLRGFPRRTLRGDLPIHRIHKAGRGRWWCSQDGSGRFDPVGTGHGACYLADRPIGAWVEVFRKRKLLPEDEVRARALLSVALGRDLRLADFTSRRALSFGVTAAVGAGESYDASHRFAAEALAAGLTVSVSGSGTTLPRSSTGMRCSRLPGRLPPATRCGPREQTSRSRTR